MNNNRRKQIQAVLSILGDAQSQLEGLADEEREAFDNMPESLQQSERGQACEQAADALSDASDNVKSAIDSLDQLG